MGWVHGDSHLGNFIVDVRSMRMYMIDLERCHPSTSAVLQFFDVQEMFGHACSLLVDMPYTGRWDMHDIQGVTAKLHPLICSKDSKKEAAFCMLPVCNCFTGDCVLEKTKGCIYCKSQFNVANAKYYKTMDGFSSMVKALNTTSIEILSSKVKIARDETRMQCEVTCEILSNYQHLLDDCICSISPETLSFSMLEGETSTNIMPRLRAQRILYLGGFIPGEYKLGMTIIRLLAKKKAKKEATMLSGFLVKTAGVKPVRHKKTVHVASSASESKAPSLPG